MIVNLNMTSLKLRELKARSQRLQPVIRVGKAGLDTGVIQALDEALTRHGLVKVKLEAFKEEKKAMFAQLAERTGSRIILPVGHTVTLWRAEETPEGLSE